MNTTTSAVAFDLYSPKGAFRVAVKDAPEIGYNSAWENGTGYFDQAVFGEHAPVLESGQVVKTTDQHGRLIGMVGTAVGNVVVFDRFSSPTNQVVTFNGPTVLMRMMGFTGGTLSVDKIDTIFGAGGNCNIGEGLDALVTSAEKHKRAKAIKAAM